MRFLTRYAIWVAAPLALASGCAGPSWLASGNRARDVDPTQRMLQVAKSYEASGDEQAAERVYRQLAHMQPHNAEVRQRLDALARSASGQQRKPVDAQAKPQADTQELLAILRRNREAYEASKYGEAEPTLADPLPSIARASSSPAGIPPAPAAEEVAGPWEHAIVAASPQQPSREFAPYEPTIDSSWTESASEQVAAASDNTLPRIQPHGQSSLVAQQATVVPTDEESPFSETDAVDADSELAVADAGTEESEGTWWDSVFADGTQAPALAHSEEAGTEAELAVETEAGMQTEAVAMTEDAWTRTSEDRLCPDLKPELEPLVAALSAPEADLRITALNSLGLYGTDAASAELAIRVLLEDENPLVRAHAAAALREVKHDAWDSVKTLRMLVFHPSDEVAQVACYLLGRIGVEAMDATPELVTLRDAERGLTSLHAAEALVRIAPHDTESVAVLIEASEQGEQQARWFATVALSSSGAPTRDAVVKALTARLQDESEEVRAAAALSLGGLGTDADIAKQALEYAALHDTPEVQDAANTALACLQL